MANNYVYFLYTYEIDTRTGRLTKCCEPLQKLRVRLGTCKIDLSPPVILYSEWLLPTGNSDFTLNWLLPVDW